jgi:diadenosine tetraphosphatase ApaH/serine/threonine PP2A family protein phosphatase
MVITKNLHSLLLLIETTDPLAKALLESDPTRWTFDAETGLFYYEHMAFEYWPQPDEGAGRPGYVLIRFGANPVPVRMADPFAVFLRFFGDKLKSIVRDDLDAAKVWVALQEKA